MSNRAVPEDGVLVIGAGIGGLCLAQGLKRAGIPCAVYERDESPQSRLQGYRLHIAALGIRALREVLPDELYARFEATSLRPRPIVPRFDDQLVLRAITEFPEPGVNVNRMTLRHILLSELDDVHFGKRLTRFDSDNDGVTAYFADGATARGRVLVGADGVHSPVRRQYLPHARIEDTGLRQLYGKIPLNERTRPLFDDEMHAVFSMILGPDHTLVGVAPVAHPEPFMTCSVGLRSERIGLSDEELATLSGGQLRELALKQVDGWHPRVRAMVSNWALETVFPLVIRTSVPFAQWTPSRVTLLGDAVHAMSPAAGAGANAALRDGAALAAALSAGPDEAVARGAIAAYEEAMTSHGFAAVRESATNGHQFLGQNPLPV
ncbi:FAD-dependent oxidoreductase [Nocardia pseudobrasiliensis]|uniref:2-polyprenyl-6-methoxyphenol hydroxylase-like FAD-dependent oxidoreductase n=1 Tax=Nocardia pseudobrasiliensis TaxID=45979 RepID=A0A370HPX9_9NOCA|nr:NAD(P)/FAD-dependent oxidoreductase [Nocardia pseudobrasiliensis]RDI60380.1 2-polyprenyl-6-methoxyphenol hydroxylase-like FAD-dependent oxidoreductase [Nocardia pseudobrasiliensis]